MLKKNDLKRPLYRPRLPPCSRLKEKKVQKKKKRHSASLEDLYYQPSPRGSRWSKSSVMSFNGHLLTPTPCTEACWEVKPHSCINSPCGRLPEARLNACHPKLPEPRATPPPAGTLQPLWCNCLTAVTQYFPGERPSRDCSAFRSQTSLRILVKLCDTVTVDSASPAGHHQHHSSDLHL